MDYTLRLATQDIVLAHFATGLAFFAMGLAVALELGHAKGYPFRKALVFLAAFGFLLATEEWLDMSETLTQLVEPELTTAQFGLEALITVLAFLALMQYGLQAWQLVNPRRDWRRWLLPGLTAAWLVGTLILLFTVEDRGAMFRASEVWARYVLGLPAAALAAYAFLVQRRSAGDGIPPRYGGYLTAAAWAFIWYAVLDWVIAPPSVIWPSTVINTIAFRNLVGVPVQIFRAIVAFVAAFCILRALQVVELQERSDFADAQRRALQAEEARRREAEEHGSQLARLARELSALLETTRVVASWLDMEKLAKEALERIVELFDGAECGCILVSDPATGKVETTICSGTETPCADALQMADEAIRLGRGSARSTDHSSVICVPLKSERWVLGVMSLANPREAGRFTERELQQAQALANQVAVGMEKAWLHREVQRREKMLKRLLERVVAAQEEERRRIARELHDETGQSLTALVTGLGAVENVVVSDPKLAERRLKQLLQFGVQAMEEVDRMIADLRPTLLDDLGLVAALRWLVESNKDRLPPVKLDLSLGKTRLPRQLEVELFRIAQESLKNISRHAQAKSVRLSLKADAGSVGLLVEDDGVGFDPQAAMDPLSPRPAWGLLGMRERAEGLGGAMTIESRPGAGTRVAVEIPLMEEVRHEPNPSASGR